MELEDDTSPEHKTKREEGEEKMKEEEDQEKSEDNHESQEKVDVPLQEPVQGIMEEQDFELQLQDAVCSEEIKELEQQLSTLDLDSSAQAPAELNDPETPPPLPDPELGNNPQPQEKPNAQPYVSAVACSTRSNSSSSESTACSLRQSASVASTPEILPKPQQVFSPFPCVKVPRKSMAARNLGLYGPTSRTPNVHFPHMSKTMTRVGTAVAVSTRRRWLAASLILHLGSESEPIKYAEGLLFQYILKVQYSSIQHRSLRDIGHSRGIDRNDGISYLVKFILCVCVELYFFFSSKILYFTKKEPNSLFFSGIH